MADRIEKLIKDADFTKESNLYERLEKQLFSNKTIDFMKDRKLAEEDLEMLAAAGSADNLTGRADNVAGSADDDKESQTGRRYEIY
jgi:hypothetical protein